MIAHIFVFEYSQCSIAISIDLLYGESLCGGAWRAVAAMEMVVVVAVVVKVMVLWARRIILC